MYWNNLTNKNTDVLVYKIFMYLNGRQESYGNIFQLKIDLKRLRNLLQ